MWATINVEDSLPRKQMERESPPLKSKLKSLFHSRDTTTSGEEREKKRGKRKRERKKKKKRMRGRRGERCGAHHVFKRTWYDFFFWEW